MEKLLKILSENARISLEDLAAMTGMGTAEVAAALDDYRTRGIIHGYQALIDWEKAGANHVQALIELRVTPNATLVLTKWHKRLPLLTKWTASC